MAQSHVAIVQLTVRRRDITKMLVSMHHGNHTGYVQEADSFIRPAGEASVQLIQVDCFFQRKILR